MGSEHLKLLIGNKTYRGKLPHDTTPIHLI